MNVRTSAMMAAIVVLAFASQLFAQKIVLLEGEFDLPFASINHADVPGWHEPLSVVGLVPSDLPAISGAVLKVSLWDASRPNQTCSSDHPLSGCATVDWSDVPGPRVPAGGVFDNHLFLELANGNGDFFLSENDGLAEVPDVFVPS